MKKSEFALESFKNIQELIRFMDQKAGAILIVAGLIFTGYIEYAKTMHIVSFESWSIFGLASFFSGFATLSSLLYLIYITLFQILIPRLAKNYKKDEYSLFYFEHIVQLGKKDTKEAISCLKEGEMLNQLIDQQHEVSEILLKKTEQIASSFRVLFFSMISLVIFILTSFQL